RRQDAPDAVDFHAAMRRACDAHNPEWHTKYKAQCDEYFFLPHRGEPRGVGGIFYDRHDSGDFERDFAFTRDVGEAFLKAYPPICATRAHEPWTHEEREEQLVRRGRYVEFNLLYDRGTTFGLKTGGNVESILSSMPPTGQWPWASIRFGNKGHPPWAKHCCKCCAAERQQGRQSGPRAWPVRPCRPAAI